jgi:LmbE family N-acetylglucosaminyl deacetylase
LTGTVRRTVVSFHAHPDDEALLTAGTLARLAAEGHRVVLVVATAGEAGLASRAHAHDLGARRRRELAASAAALGVSRVEVLGYADSGWSGAPGAPVAGGERAFARVPVETAAAELARLLVEERADVLTTYDAAGGYGHPDHVQVHRVGRRAAELAGTPLVLEATVDRRLLLRVARPLARLARVLRLPAVPDLSAAYTDRADLTHRVDVRDHLAAKRAALRAHASQAGADDGARTLALLLRLPGPVARRVLGTEWFREPGRVPGTRPLDDVLTTLRTSQEAR